MKNNETIADIIAEMRDEAARADMEQECSIDDAASAAKMMREFARRLEAAHKREMRDAVTICNQFGNAAKLREALAYLFTLIDMRKLVLDCDETEDIYAVQVMLDECRAALAAPPRNCDVGTADDWLARFNVVCERCSGSDCDHRLFKDEEVCDCFARWLQMPYEEGGAK